MDASTGEAVVNANLTLRPAPGSAQNPPEDVETLAWLDPEFVKPEESKGVAVTADPSGQHQLQLRAIAAGT